MAATKVSNQKSRETRSQEPRTTLNFFRNTIIEKVRTNTFGDANIQTRFPPEPNGYLHICDDKAICLEFGLAGRMGDRTNLRFDDTIPSKEGRK